MTSPTPFPSRQQVSDSCSSAAQDLCPVHSICPFHSFHSTLQEIHSIHIRSSIHPFNPYLPTSSPFHSIPSLSPYSGIRQSAFHFAVHTPLLPQQSVHRWWREGSSTLPECRSVKRPGDGKTLRVALPRCTQRSRKLSAQSNRFRSCASCSLLHSPSLARQRLLSTPTRTGFSDFKSFGDVHCSDSASVMASSKTQAHF